MNIVNPNITNKPRDGLKFKRLLKTHSSNNKALLKESTSPSVKEAYKLLRTNLILALNKTDNRRFVITSAVPNEGKTTTCCNIGITLAQMNSRVLIIDSDLRKPRIHELFMLSKSPGLSEVLEDKTLFDKAVQITNFNNLEVLCAGEIPSNPIELLGSLAMEKLINQLAGQYDYILIDMPPVNLVADALTVSNLVDGVVLVVREKETKHPEFQRALSSLDFSNAKILGVVLNDVNISRIFGPQYGYKKYNKYYR